MLEQNPVQARSCICQQEQEKVQRQALSKQYSGSTRNLGIVFTFKAGRVLYTVRLETYRCAGTSPNTCERGSKGRKWAVRLPRNLLNFSASVASSGMLLPISWDDQSPKHERPRNSLMSLHYREIFKSCRPDFVLIKTFLTFRAGFLDSIPKLLVNVRSLPPLREGFLALSNQEFQTWGDPWFVGCRDFNFPG